MSNRIPLIAGNWKMYKTAAQAADTARQLMESVDLTPEREVMIAPPFTALVSVAAVIQNSPISLGAQNLFWEDEGAFTGEVSPVMLLDAGCRHVIIGHSERRQLFGESDETVNKRIRSALKHGLIPVFCIGETEEQRASDETFSVLDKQVENGLEGLSSNDLEALVLAYEPVWAIGTGKTATSGQAQEVHGCLRAKMADRYGDAFADSIRILYGGSVKPNNAAELMSMPDIDGALVGGASLRAEDFAQIINY